MAGYTYAQWVTTVTTMMPASPSDPDIVTMLPNAIDYAEQRIYRELDLLDTVFRDSSSQLVTNNRNFTLPGLSTSVTTGEFITTQGINVITPVATQPDSGTRNQLVAVSPDYLDMAWPSVTGASVPQFYAMLTQDTLIVGPWPDAAYVVEVRGTIRPAALSATNTATFLTQNLPDLFLAASMVFVAGWMKDYGSQADDPQLAQSWEGQYGKLMGSAQIEEARKKYQGPAWTPLSPAPLATPPRA